MAIFKSDLPKELIAQFERLNLNADTMLGDMVKAGAEVALENIDRKMPRSLRDGLGRENIVLSRVYRTPSDDGIACQAMIVGYFENRNGKRTPAPLVANMFEYGSSTRQYPREPFLRSSFKENEITEAMLRAQRKYIEEG